MGEAVTRARFPEVPLDAGHYESFYLKACHPSDPLGVWIRYTVHKRPGHAPRGSVWFTLFDGSAGGPVAFKETLDDVAAGPDELIHVGASRFLPGHVEGSALEASWELSFDGAAEPLWHLPRGWMYRAPVPRTKLLSPYPAARFSGMVRVAGREVSLERWPGMVGHNWGAEHAERWIWLHGAGFEERPDAWLDAAIGRVRLGPVTLPWIANGVLSLDGERIRLGGPERARSTKIAELPDRCEFTLPGRGLRVEGTVGSGRSNFVGWVYADPDGSEHNTVNCSISDMTLRVVRDGRTEELNVRAGAAYELGMRETDHGMAIQPFPDG